MACPLHHYQKRANELGITAFNYEKKNTKNVRMSRSATPARNGSNETFETSKKHPCCRPYHRHGHFANGCGRLQIVAIVKATSCVEPKRSCNLGQLWADHATDKSKKLDTGRRKNEHFVRDFPILTFSTRYQTVGMSQVPCLPGKTMFPTCLVSSLWFSCGLAVCMGKSANLVRFPSRLSWHFVTFQPV